MSKEELTLLLLGELEVAKQMKPLLELIVFSWGYTSHPGEASANLQWTKVITIGNDECRSKMTRTNSVKVVDSSICAVALETGGACELFDVNSSWNYLMKI